jgi:ketosteroid isomerase-like protein
MRKILVALPLFLFACFLSAQSQDIEKEIRRLEETEVKAVLAKDTNTLKKLWGKDYVVNNPANKIVLANANPVDRPVLNRPRTSFTREVEHVTINGNIAISMGNETVVPAGDEPQAAQTVKRRYTNIWMKIDGSWKLVARHANQICQETSGM